MTRCSWADSHPLLLTYHDQEWGLPSHDDRHLFEMLILEGAQAGLSWLTVLQRRGAYRSAFADFDLSRISRFGVKDVNRLLAPSSGIIRNRRKVEGAIRTAVAILDVTAEFGSLDHYIWQFVDGRPLQNGWRTLAEIPARTGISVKISKDLLARGCSFVGPTICYAFMQACGLVNDHLVGCFRRNEVVQA